MNIFDKMKVCAQASRQRIVLPEGDELRTLKAANEVLKEKIADIILLSKPAVVAQMAQENGLEFISQALVIDPENNPDAQKYADLLFELRKEKGMTEEQAQKLVKDPLYLGCLMLKNGDVDGSLAGARSTTGNVLRPALQIIRTVKGISVVSGALMLISKDETFGEEGLLMIADVAVSPNPNAQELAQIAVSTGETMRALCKKEPRVAMLSFSTKGSAKHEMVDKVALATKLAKEMAPDMKIDGELQADAALVPAVAQIKAPDSTVAGKANTLVFPSLEVGNISYKLVQRLGGAIAVGPVLQGMAAPVNDLSRGCSVEDIIDMIIITCNQAIAKKS